MGFLGSKNNKGINNRDNNKSRHKIQVKDILIKFLPINLCMMKKQFHMNDPKIVCVSCYKTMLQLPPIEEAPHPLLITHKTNIKEVRKLPG